MIRTVRYLSLLIGVTFGTILGWRLLSRRYALPCPSWLAWLLENPYMDMVARAERTIVNMNVQPGMKILDVGCGPGRLTIPLAVSVGDKGTVIGLDIQPAMLIQAQQRVDKAGLTNVQLVQAEANRPMFAPNTFDRAILVTVLGEIPDRRAALAAIFDALKPGGMLTVTEVLPDPHYQRVKTARALSAAVGFMEDSYVSSRPAYTISFIKPE